MASVNSDSELTPQLQQGGSNNFQVNNEIINTKKKKLYFPRFGCFRIEHDATGENFDIQVVDASGHRPNPTHLIIMVNGLIGRFSFFPFSPHFLKLKRKTGKHICLCDYAQFLIYLLSNI